MKTLWPIFGYFAVSAFLYLVCREKCKKDAVFRMPKSKALFYILSFVWAFPSTLVGFVVALFVWLNGYIPKKYGRVLCFEIPEIDFGVEFGLFIIVPTKTREETKQHEHGHAIQNIYLGVFALPVVSIPSAIRYWYRKVREKHGKPCQTDYDAIWFEKSATESGKCFFKSI